MLGSLAVQEDEDTDEAFEWLAAEDAKEATSIYELLLVAGADPGVAKLKVCELFSVPRVTQQLERLPRLSLLAPGSTFDLREDREGRRWNFLRVEDRKEVRRRIQEERPYVVIGSPHARRSAASPA